MTGDMTDMQSRIKALLPARWFGDDTPILDGVLAGFGAVWAELYDLLAMVRGQARIATASGGFLDKAAADFFGGRLRRRAGQTDDSLRAAISRELQRERATRPALISAVTELTGREPWVFEPTRAADTKAWGVASGYGVAGGWGTLTMPFACLVVAYRPTGTGITTCAGWGTSAGGWGQGTIQYASLDMLSEQVSDDDINNAVAGVMPVSTTAWLRITN